LEQTRDTNARNSTEEHVYCVSGGLVSVRFGVPTVDAGDDSDTPVLDIEVLRETGADEVVLRAARGSESSERE
jgi:hypothetical protein